MSGSTSQSKERNKVTIHSLLAKKQRGEMITMLTAYDYPTALAVDRAGIDIILVGDSLGMVVLGYENTLPVTMEDMLHHCRAVSRGSKKSLLVGDMPFMSYQTSTYDAVRNAGRFIQDAGMDSVKLEGGVERCDAVKAIVSTGIPVMGHLGLTPQSIHQFGGFKVQGRAANAARRLLEDALLLQDAGCYSIVLEGIPARIAEIISKKLVIPTIGIGAGGFCDGQVLVTHDLLGLFDRFTPKFAKKYTDLHAEIGKAINEYREEVEKRLFPGEEHSFEIDETEWELFINGLE